MKKTSQFLYQAYPFLMFLMFCCLPFSTIQAQKRQKKLSPTAQNMAKQGFVNVLDYDSTIHVSLMYSRPDNFTGRVLYSDLREAYLHPMAAKALAQAQKELKRRHPNLSLIIYDAGRPMSVQQKMWDAVKGTSKNIYVSNPANGGGLHNYGFAVDISICNEHGDSISMGTVVDYLGKLAHPEFEPTFLRQGKITKQAVENRQLLREVMAVGGFKVLRTEWWHFNLKTRKQVKAEHRPFIK